MRQGFSFDLRPEVQLGFLNSQAIAIQKRGGGVTFKLIGDDSILRAELDL